MGFESGATKKGKVIDTEVKHLTEDDSFARVREKMKVMSSTERRDMASSLHALRSRVESEGVSGLNTFDKVRLYGLTPIACVVGLTAWAIVGPLAGLPALLGAGVNMMAANSGYKKELLQRIDVLLAAMPGEYVNSATESVSKDKPVEHHETALLIDRKSFAEMQKTISGMTQIERDQFKNALSSFRKRVEEHGVEGLTSTDVFLRGATMFETALGAIAALLGPSAGSSGALLPLLLLSDSDKKTKVLKRIDELISILEQHK